MQNWALSLFALILLATPVVAGPNQNIWVNDTLFAQTRETVLILRTVSDNQASYYSKLTDTFLLTLSRKDGAMIDVAPVERVVEVSGLDPEHDGMNFQPIDDAVNPFDICKITGAAPLSDPEVHPYRRAELDNVGLHAINGDDTTHRLVLAGVKTQLEQSLAQTRITLPLIGDEASFSVFTTGLSHLLAECEADRVTSMWFARGEETASALVRLSCDHDEEAGTSTYWVVVPSI